MMKKVMGILMISMVMNQCNVICCEKEKAKAVYVFGDSLVDSGNNNELITLSKANYQPYGMNFKEGPTGRFTNGRTVPDFIAEHMGLAYPATYNDLDDGEVEEEHLSGLNYASAACGLLPDTGMNLGKCLNLEEQVSLFEKTVKKELPKHYNKCEDELSAYLSKSLFVIATASNDYINNYDKIVHGASISRIYTPKYFSNLLIEKLYHQFKRLYKLGARKVVMFEIGPVGCMPSMTKKYDHFGACVEGINEFVKIFNKQLASTLRNLTSTLHGSAFVLGRTYALTYEAIMNPSKYGLSDSSNPCCVTWFNGTSSCIPGIGVLSCMQPEEHFFFDGFHSTEKVYKAVANLCFKDSNVCTPTNIQQLVT